MHGAASVHFQVLDSFLDAYWSQSTQTNTDGATPKLSVFDLAAGSGEVTEAVQSWKASRWSSQSTSTNDNTESSTTTPSRAFIPAALTKKSANALHDFPQPELEFAACDPFTGEAFTRHTGLACATLSFADLAQDQYPEPAPSTNDGVYDLTICSFALHLLTNPSELWALLQTLQYHTRYLVVIAPHKQPQIKEGWGFIRLDPRTLQDVNVDDKADVGGDKGDGAEIVLDRVRLRIWRSAMQ